MSEQLSPPQELSPSARARLLREAGRKTGEVAGTFENNTQYSQVQSTEMERGNDPSSIEHSPKHGAQKAAEYINEQAIDGGKAA